MAIVGIFSQFSAALESEWQAESPFCQTFLPINVETAPITWFTFREEGTTFGLFAAFANPSERRTHLSPIEDRIRRISKTYSVEQVDIIVAKRPQTKEIPHVTLGFSVRVEIRPDTATEMENALRATLPRIEEEPATIAWFAFRRGPTTFGVFDVFPDETGRQAHLSNFNSSRSVNIAHLLTQPFHAEKVNLLAGKLV